MPRIVAGTGTNGNTITHVEGHAVAIMYERGVTKATLLIEKPPCGSCDNPAAVPSISAMLPKGAQLTVVDPHSATYYRSTR